jgi:hypothetical protein
MTDGDPRNEAIRPTGAKSAESHGVTAQSPGAATGTPGTTGGAAPALDAGAHPAVRVVLAIYGAALAVTGVWAAAFPRSFYDDFPGFGRVWVAVDGPFNEHLVRDVGSLNLALAALLAVAAIRTTPLLVGVAAGVNLVNAIPHLVYHLRNLDPLGTTDQVANVVVLVAALVAAAALLWWAARARPRLTDSG